MSPTGGTKSTKSSDEFAGLARDVNVRELVLQIAGSKLPDIDVSESAISGEILRTIEGASEITVVVHDQARDILESGMLFDTDGHLRSVDVTLDGVWFRLVSWSKEGDDLRLKLEDRRIARLRTKMGPKKAASRADVTRAQYILTLVRSVKADKRLPVHFFELRKKQPVVAPDSKTRKRATKAEDRQAARDAKRGRGFSDKAHTDLGLTKKQLDNIGIYMDQVELLSAPEKATLAGLVAGFGESDWSKSAVNGTHRGVFQSDQIDPSDLESQSFHFLSGDLSFRSGGAIQAAKDHPTWTPGMIASWTEISDANGSHYDKHLRKAQDVLAAWGGSTGGQASANSDSTYYKRYEFSVDKDENYWDAIQRMAKEVNWRAFVSGNTLFYIHEQALMESRARYSVSEDTPGVSNIDADQDYRKRTARARISCRIDAWAAPPGTIVVINGLNTSGSKRWLVESITRNLFSPEATIECKRPMGVRKEPRSDLQTRASKNQIADRGSLGGGTPDDLYYECNTISDAGPGYDYGGGHGDLLASMKSDDPMDCSSSCSLALYRAGLFGNRKQAMTSGEFASSWGRPGKGDGFTVWANAVHMFIEFHGDADGYRFDTSPHTGDVPSTRGARLRKGKRSTEGFIPRHAGTDKKPVGLHT